VIFRPVWVQRRQEMAVSQRDVGARHSDGRIVPDQVLEVFAVTHRTSANSIPLSRRERFGYRETCTKILPVTLQR
jgi:hypothetical protein